MSISTSYPFGLRVFLRTTNAQGDLHFVDLPNGRGFSEKPSLHFYVLDADLKVVAILIPDAVSFFLPLVDPTTVTPEPESRAKN